MDGNDVDDKKYGWQLNRNISHDGGQKYGWQCMNDSKMDDNIWMIKIWMTKFLIWQLNKNLNDYGNKNLPLSPPSPPPLFVAVLTGSPYKWKDTAKLRPRGSVWSATLPVNRDLVTYTAGHLFLEYTSFLSNNPSRISLRGNSGQPSFTWN